MILFRYSVFILAGIILPAGIAMAQETNPRDNETVLTIQNDETGDNQSLLEYLDLIAEQERLHGPYDPQLSEQLLGLGLLYKNMGNYDEAGEALKRSLHIKKVNDGIQSMNQVPVLEALIEVNTKAEKWDELNQNYHLLLWVHQRNLQSGDPSLLPVIERVGKWKLAAYVNGLLSEAPSTTLNDIVDMYKSTVDILTELYGENDPRLLGPLKGLSLVQYQQVNMIMNQPVMEFQSVGRRETVQRRCFPVMLPNGVITTVCQNSVVPNPQYYVDKQNTKDMTVARHMSAVRNSLNRIVKLSSINQVSTYEQAASLVNLADWYLLNSKRATALDNYRKAYQLLVEDNYEPKYIEALFGKPVRIPRMSSTPPDPDAETEFEIPRPFVRLAFEVTTEGKARRIKIIEESEPGNIVIRKYARQQVANSLFRPRFEEGEPVATDEAELLLYGAALDKDSIQNSRTHEDRFDSIVTRSRMR